MPDSSDKVEVISITTPGRVERLDRTKFEAMRDALLDVLPAEAPGLTVAQAKERLLPLLSQDIYPGGDKAGWWLKAVQLDQEARGVIARAAGSPVRLYRL